MHEKLRIARILSEVSSEVGKREIKPKFDNTLLTIL